MRIQERPSEKSERVRAAEGCRRGHCRRVLARHAGGGSVCVSNGGSTCVAVSRDLAIPHSERFEDGMTDKVPIALFRRSCNHVAEDAVAEIRIVKSFVRWSDYDTEPIDDPIGSARCRRSAVEIEGGESRGVVGDSLDRDRIPIPERSAHLE